MKEHPIRFTAEMVRATLSGLKTQTRQPIDMKRLQVVPRKRVSSDLPSEFDDSRLHVNGGKRIRAGMNPIGAVYAQLADGKTLGLKPEEFDFVCPYAEGRTVLVYVGKNPLGHNDNQWTIIPKDSRLWVQETWCVIDVADTSLGNILVGYPAGPESDFNRFWIHAPKADVENLLANLSHHHKASIYMPRWACRLTRDVVSVRIQRLQDITEADAMAEGVVPLEHVGKDQPIAGDDPKGRTHETHPYTLALAVQWDEIYGDRAPWVSNPWVWATEYKGR